MYKRGEKIVFKFTVDLSVLNVYREEAYLIVCDRTKRSRSAKDAVK